MNGENKRKMTASDSVVGATAKQPYVRLHNESITEKEEEFNPEQIDSEKILEMREAVSETPPSEPQTIEAVASMLDRNERGALCQSIGNCVLVLQNDPLFRGTICRNELTCRIDLINTVPWKRRGITLTDTDINQIRWYLEKNYGLTSEKQIKAGIDIVSCANAYHPVRERIKSLRWDGRQRICHVLKRYLGVNEDEYSEQVIKVVLLGLIERVFNPGCKFEYMMCLIGGQGAGKSSFCSALAMEDDWFTDDVKRLDDEHIYRRLQGHIVIEFAEMAPLMSAKNVEETKAFISRRKDTYKIPYETHPEDRPRQCIFIGSSNRHDALPADRTGNRRFLPVMVDAKNADHHPMENETETREYLSQCIAEAYELWLNGERPVVTDAMEEQIKKMQSQFAPEDTTAGLVKAWLTDCVEEYVCTFSIFEGVFNREASTARSWELREISEVMHSSLAGDWESMKCHRFPKFGQQRGWKRKKM